MLPAGRQPGLERGIPQHVVRRAARTGGPPFRIEWQRAARPEAAYGDGLFKFRLVELASLGCSVSRRDDEAWVSPVSCGVLRRPCGSRQRLAPVWSAEVTEMTSAEPERRVGCPDGRLAHADPSAADAGCQAGVVAKRESLLEGYGRIKLAVPRADPDPVGGMTDESPALGTVSAQVERPGVIAPEGAGKVHRRHDDEQLAGAVVVSSAGSCGRRRSRRGSRKQREIPENNCGR